jgi:signal transduction histidine kinase
MKLGRLILVRDITEQKRTHLQLLEQQRALGTFEERERLARELHDNLGQVLGYVKMQAHAARNLLAQDQPAQVDDYLARLIKISQDAHTDVHNYILGVKSSAVSAHAFLPALKDYLQRVQDAYGIRAALELSPQLDTQSLEPMVSAQLLRIIQEAVMNVCKHAHTSQVYIEFKIENNHVQVTVEDNGQGFDSKVASKEGLHFGLSFMRERAELVGGTVQVLSELGHGTHVMITIPLSGQVNQ